MAFGDDDGPPPAKMALFGAGAVVQNTEGKWKCDSCKLHWDDKAIECQMCEIPRPGYTKEQVAAAKADLMNKFKSDGAGSTNTASAIFGGGSGNSGAGGGAFSFGVQSGGADGAPPAFSFGAAPSGGSSSLFGEGAPAASSAGGTSGLFGTTGITSGSSIFGGAGASFAPAPPAGGAGGFVFNQAKTHSKTDAALVAHAKKCRKGGDADDARLRQAATGNPVIPTDPQHRVDENLKNLNVLIWGMGECDQLGLGDDVLEKQKPALMKQLSSKKIRMIACGEIHALALMKDSGKIFSWGNSDHSALGRATDATPLKVADLARRPENRPAPVEFFNKHAQKPIPSVGIIQTCSEKCCHLLSWQGEFWWRRRGRPVVEVSHNEWGSCVHDEWC